jgi:hypothetical protein
MNIGVYAVVNKVTGQMYIGSSANLKQRLINQRSFLKTGHRCAISALKNQKVNIDDFDFRVLLETQTVEEAKEIETALLECFWGTNLYNKSPHSDGSTGVKRDHAVYSVGTKKQWADPEKKAQRSAAMRGKREVVECPHCQAKGGGGNMRRYHFDKCATKEQA